MFNPSAVLAASFGDHLAQTFLQAFPGPSAPPADILGRIAQEALGHLHTTDAPYHNAEHTIMVTLVGQQIMIGKHQSNPVPPEDWLHYIVALLLHDVGFKRGVCPGDTATEVVIDDTGTRVCPPRGATDAYLAPYHVDRGMIFARARFADCPVIDAERIAGAIEFTRFPVPDEPAFACVDSDAALVRAADLIGQIADPLYLCKISALFSEFRETGFADKRGCTTPMDLLEDFPSFFHSQVEPLIGPALTHLKQTDDGQQIVTRLYDCVSLVTRKKITLGPFPGP